MSIHPEAQKLLDGKFENITAPDSEQETLRKLAEDADAIIMRTNTTLTADIIAGAKNLKIVSRTGAGVDNVDVKAAAERGILVCNVVGVNTAAVVEHTVSFILALAKQHFRMDRAVRAGDWKIRNKKIPMEVEGKTFGIIAMGNIGSRVAKVMHDFFGMKILACDPFVQDKFTGYDYTFTNDLKELFRQADFVSVHCPNIPETQGLVSKELLALMKSSAFLINTARGGVVDQTALTDALKDGRIAGAALDVFQPEPPSADDELLSLENVICTPHCAALTEETTKKVAIEAAQAVIDFFDGKQPKWVYNKKQL